MHYIVEILEFCTYRLYDIWNSKNWLIWRKNWVKSIVSCLAVAFPSGGGSTIHGIKYESSCNLRCLRVCLHRRTGLWRRQRPAAKRFWHGSTARHASVDGAVFSIQEFSTKSYSNSTIVVTLMLGCSGRWSLVNGVKELNMALSSLPSRKLPTLTARLTERLELTGQYSGLWCLEKKTRKL